MASFRTYFKDIIYNMKNKFPKKYENNKKNHKKERVNYHKKTSDNVKVLEFEIIKSHSKMKKYYNRTIQYKMDNMKMEERRMNKQDYETKRARIIKEGWLIRKHYKGDTETGREGRRGT